MITEVSMWHPGRTQPLTSLIQMMPAVCIGLTLPGFFSRLHATILLEYRRCIMGLTSLKMTATGAEKYQQLSVTSPAPDWKWAIPDFSLAVRVFTQD